MMMMMMMYMMVMGCDDDDVYDGDDDDDRWVMIMSYNYDTYLCLSLDNHQSIYNYLERSIIDENKGKHFFNPLRKVLFNLQAVDEESIA